MMARSTTTLQSEAAYIDARPQSRQIDENLLRRTAGPYIWVIFTRSAASALALFPDSCPSGRLPVTEELAE
jgi:hypothetical protein